MSSPACARTASPGRTWVSRLMLTNFRNYSQLSLSLDARPVVLTGPNGSGKTNCLEALSLLSPGRGLRGQPFAVLPRQDGDGSWAVAARACAGADEFTVGTGASVETAGAGPKASRTVRIDGASARTPRALAERLRIVWLTPAMDGLFTGPAADRRRFLDRLVLTVDPSFAGPAAAFERAMRQRNRALEDFAAPSLLDALEVQMADAAVAMAYQRRAAVSALVALRDEVGEGKVGEGIQERPFPWFSLALQGDLEDRAAESRAGEVEDWYAGRLRDGRERDRAARRTLVGPHRSDLVVVHGPKAMPAALCSTGEQKALLLGLVLAQCRLVKTISRGLAPLLLLDEVAAHLDATRRAALYGEILALGAQAWLTGTDRPVFAPLEERGEAQVFLVSNGTILRAEGEEFRPNH